jgi:putative flippase GtrA
VLRAGRDLVAKYYMSFFVYAGLGGACALVEWAVFYGALRTGQHYITASIIGFLVATWLNYVLSSEIGFRPGGRSAFSSAFLVYVASLVGLAINLLAMVVLIEALGMDTMASKILGTGVAFGWNFTARQFLIFSATPRWTGVAAADDANEVAH